MTNQPSVPRTPVEKPSERKKQVTRFNLGLMVERTLYVTLVKAICLQNGLQKSVDFFEGVLSGYNGWYQALGVSPDVFEAIQSKLDKNKLRKQAEEFVKEMVHRDAHKIFIPTNVESVKMAKEMFDQKLKLGGL